MRYDCATRSAVSNNCNSSGGGGHGGNAFLPASSSLTLKRKRVHLLKKTNTENSIKVSEKVSLFPLGLSRIELWNDFLVEVVWSYHQLVSGLPNPVLLSQW